MGARVFSKMFLDLGPWVNDDNSMIWCIIHEMLWDHNQQRILGTVFEEIEPWIVSDMLLSASMVMHCVEVEDMMNEESLVRVVVADRSCDEEHIIRTGTLLGGFPPRK